MSTLSPAESLRRRLSRPGLMQVPGCFDAFSALLIEDAGFPAVYVSGFGLSASALGLPDRGLMSFKEALDRAAAICAAVQIPAIVDADTGYGDALNVARTVRELARCGAAAVQLEDQVWPKRCGHTADKQVVPLEEAVEKIAAAVRVAAEYGVLVIARTDARAVEGFDAAVERCRAFAEAGADLIFFEAPRNRDEVEEVAHRVSAPLLINQVEGGKTPWLPPKELEALGYRLAIYPISLLLAVTEAMRAQLRGRTESGEWSGWSGMTGFQDVVALLRFDQPRL